MTIIQVIGLACFVFAKAKDVDEVSDGTRGEKALHVIRLIFYFVFWIGVFAAVMALCYINWILGRELA